MIDDAPRLLFVPVSGAFGMGEYARSLAIAQAAVVRWPAMAVHFILSREAPYASNVPFPTTLLASSPTFHTRAVVGLIDEWRPDLVIFDNAGRTAQLRAAKRSGARVVFISARRRQRRKAFRLRWMGLLDEHWIAYPEFIAGSLSVGERLKLRLMGRPRVRYLDVVLASRNTPSTPVPFVDGYALVVPGGGTGHPGTGDAVAQFAAVAGGLAAAGMDTVFVAGAGAAVPGSPPHLYQPGALPQAQLGELMRGARLIVTNGGATLLQGIASGRPCIGAPIAGDQGARIDACVRAGVALAGPLDSGQLLRMATDLWKDEERRESLAGRAIALGLTDGIALALRAIEPLLPESPE